MYRYSLHALGKMFSDEQTQRADAFYQAMAKVITPESVVLEIGTGVGFFALLACQLGARHVYAVEPNPLIQLGREIARDNGYADRITFIQGLSHDISLPERADVVVSDMRGTIPWLAGHIPSICDARKRLLKPNSALIPMQDTVWAAIVTAQAAYANRFAMWEENSFGLDLSAARQQAVNRHGKVRISAEQLLTTPSCWATLDYRTIVETNAKAKLHWQATKEGVAHGIGVWFESELTDGVLLSNAPDQPYIPIYSQCLFPFEQPVQIEVGDSIDVTIQNRFAASKYTWSWQTTITTPTGATKAHFNQSNFLGYKYDHRVSLSRVVQAAPS